MSTNGYSDAPTPSSVEVEDVHTPRIVTSAPLATQESNASRAPQAPQGNSGRQKTPRVNLLGLTVLHDGGEAPVADIVFVHGIQGHPQTTWTYTTGATSDPKAANKKSSLFHQVAAKFKENWKHSDNGSSRARTSTPTEGEQAEPGFYWPAELLPVDFKSCRVLTFGYDSHVSRFFDGPANKNGILEHGNDLLKRLEAARREGTACTRKIIFIVHSLGGLILKEALRLARTANDEDLDYKNVFESTFAIMFFSTPHRGSDYADLGLLAANVAMAMGMDANDTNLRNLKPNSELPSLLLKDFAQILSKNRIYIDTFLEAQGFSGYGPLRGKIVEADSARLGYGREREETINGNHVTMCRFYGPDDNGYIKVKEALGRHVGNIEREIQESAKTNLGMEIVSCVESLNVQAMNIRPEQVSLHYTYEWHKTTDGQQKLIRSETQEWLWDESQAGPGLVQWLRSGRGIFWIRGKAGSGKSTAMKNIWQNPLTKKNLPLYAGWKIVSNPWLIICAFFHDRGIAIQKSLAGVLSSLLYQIVKQNTNLVHFILPHALRKPKRTNTSSSRVDARGAVSVGNSTQIPTAETVYGWTTVELKAGLKAITTQTTVRLHICALVDALDEHEETEGSEEHEAMVEFFQDLVDTTSSNVQLKMIVSSRPENVFKDHFEQNEGFKIEKFTRSDIDKYIYGNLGRKLGVTPQTTFLRPQPSSSKVSNSSKPASARSSKEIQRPAILTPEVLMVKIAEKANGVFLWVRLVVHELIKQWSRNRLMSYMMKKLDEFPPDLRDLYEYILKRIAPENRLESYIMLELVLRSKRNLPLVELIIMAAFIKEKRVSKTKCRIEDRFAFKSMVEFLDKMERDLDAQNTLYKALQRILQDRCMGLLEVHGAEALVEEIEANESDVPPDMDLDSSRTFDFELEDTGVHTSQNPTAYTADAISSAHPKATSSKRSNVLKRLLQREPRVDMVEDVTIDAVPEPENMKVLRNVQFLHQTAKEYLLESTTLRKIFTEDIQGCGEDSHDGNMMFLEFCLQWFEFPEDTRRRLQVFVPYTPETEVLTYAPLLETENIPPESSTSLLSRKPTAQTRLLQAVDAKLSSHDPLGDAWPESNCDAFPERQAIDKPSTWKSNFLCFAICNSMRYYVAETLNENPGLVNAKPGRPLLHYAVYGAGTCSPQLVLDLIAQGAEINAVFKEEDSSKTAIQSFLFTRDFGAGTDAENLFKSIEYLLLAGADANFRFRLFDGSYTEVQFLYYITWFPAPEPAKLRLCKMVVERGANTDGFLEALCTGRSGHNPLIITWLLRSGVPVPPSILEDKVKFPYYPRDDPEFNSQHAAAWGLISSSNLTTTIFGRRLRNLF